MENWKIWSEGDLNQYFAQSYVGCRDDSGKLKPCYVSDIISMPETGNLGFVGKLGNKHIAMPFESDKIEVILPESMFVNANGRATYLSRVTERQYKKGVREKQYEKTDVSADECAISNFPMPRPRFNDKLIGGLLAPEFPSFDEALEMLNSGKVLSCAFDRHFCLAIKYQIPGIVLMYKSLICGKVEGDTLDLLEGFTDLEDKLIEIMEG